MAQVNINNKEDFIINDNGGGGGAGGASSYYYCIRVINSSGVGIGGATVTFGTKSSIKSLSNGIASLRASASDPATCLCTVEANGYQTKSGISVEKKENNSNPSKDVTLTSTGGSIYYYVLVVKELGTNTPISITKNNIFAHSGSNNNINFNILENIDTKSYTISCTYNSLTISIKKNGYLESTEKTINGNSSGADLSNPTVFTLGKAVECNYYYVVKAQTKSGEPIQGVKIEFSSNLGEYENTNDQGLVVKPLGKKSSPPTSTVYVYAREWPKKYYIDVENDDDTGLIKASTSDTIPGHTFIFETIEDTVYYYNVIVFDALTDNVVEGAKIEYIYNGDVIETKTSFRGVTEFSSPYKSLTIKISKSGFNDHYENIEGTLSTDGWMIDLDRNNTVQILYDDETPSDNFDNEAAINVKVVLYTYINNEYILLGEYFTYKNGYIDALNDTFYSSSQTVYVSVAKHTVVGANILTPGNAVFRIKDNRDEATDSEIESAKDINYNNTISINGIKKNLIKGNKELNTGDTNFVEYNSNDFRINIVDPDSINTYDIFTSTPVINDDNNGITSSVDIRLKPDVNNLRIKTINRYSGYYNPIFKDILFYGNFKDCPHSNVTFNYKYEDKYGKFGVINNMWFHKVNDKKSEIINTLTPYYPLTGQYALAHKDYNIFSSSWDRNYYTRQTDVNHSESCQNIASMKNGLCMFGSKYLNTPNEIEISGLTIGNDADWNGEWNDEWITNPEGCPGEVMYKEVNNNNVSFYFFLRKRILRFFYEKLKDEFAKYISDNSFGKDGLEDDIEEYVTKNILKLYKLDKIRVFVRRTKKNQHNNKIENNYVKYVEYEDLDENDKKEVSVKFFKSHGFVEVNNITMSKENRDDFDRKIVYNLRTGTKEDFGFSFILKKI